MKDPAAGKYVTRDLAADTGKVGLFTATATLTADFDADGSELDDRCGNIGGMIDDFMLYEATSSYLDGSADGNNWQLC